MLVADTCSRSRRSVLRPIFEVFSAAVSVAVSVQVSVPVADLEDRDRLQVPILVADLVSATSIDIGYKYRHVPISYRLQVTRSADLVSATSIEIGRSRIGYKYRLQVSRSDDLDRRSRIGYKYRDRSSIFQHRSISYRLQVSISYRSRIGYKYRSRIGYKYRDRTISTADLVSATSIEIGYKYRYL
jgi:hypothetical protein